MSKLPCTWPQAVCYAVVSVPVASGTMAPLKCIKFPSCVTIRASSRPCQWDVLLLQIEGRGNGIKTNVVNNVEIAKALERPPDCESHCAALACCCWAAAGSAACCAAASAPRHLAGPN